MKYIIEGNFSFYEELYKSIDQDSSNIMNNEKETCLITNLPLEDNFVTLQCKHKFNYDALYKEIYNQKCKLRLYKIHHLSPNMQNVYINSGKDYFIKCPYCRNIQFELLTDLEQDKYPKVYGINTNDKSYIRVDDGTCKGYTYKGHFYNMSKLNKCIHEGCLSTICAFNDQYKFFSCSTHMSPEINKKKLEIKKQARDAKIKIKEEKEKIKQEKAKIREEKAKIKEDKQIKIKNKKVINSVIGTNDQINEYIPPSENNIIHTCSAILKSGLNKGLPCGSNIFCEGLCKRHFTPKQVIHNVTNSLELVDLDKIDDNHVLE